MLTVLTLFYVLRNFSLYSPDSTSYLSFILSFREIFSFPTSALITSPSIADGVVVVVVVVVVEVAITSQHEHSL